MSSTFITSLSKKETQSKENPKQIEDIYLRYLIDEETKYANIDKIETYYKEAILQKYYKFNENQLSLKNKQNEYDRLLSDLTAEAFERYSFPHESFFHLYTEQIQTITKEIQIKLHDLERYNHMYNRLYFTRYMVEKRLESEQKYLALNGKQYSKYLMLKQLAEDDNSKQTVLLANMARYHNSDATRKELQKKASQVRSIENEVAMIKAKNISMRNCIKAIRASIAKTNEELTTRNKVNHYEMNVYFNKKTAFYKVILQIVSKLRLFQVKHPIDLIIKSGIMKENMMALHSDFSKVNKEIQHLNNELRKRESILEHYNAQIKENHSQLLNCLPTITALEKQKVIQKKRFVALDLQNSYNKKALLFQLVFKFVIENCGKLIKKMSSRKYTHNAKILHMIKNERELQLEELSFDEEFIRLICQLLLFFFNCLLYCLFMSFDQITSGRLLYVVNREAKKKTIRYMFSKKYLQSFKELAEKADFNVKAKLKYIKKNEENLIASMYNAQEPKEANLNSEFTLYHSSSSINEMNPRQKGSKSQRITQKELLNSFRNHLERRKRDSGNTSTDLNSFTNKSYFENHPRKILSILGKYQNDLVVKNPHLLSSSVGFNRMQSRSKIVKGALHKKLNSQEQYRDMKTSNEERCDSYENTLVDNPISTERKKEPMKTFYANKSGDEQMMKIYKRLNDLRLLKLQYKEKSGPPNELLGLFKSFKSKVLRNNSKKKLNQEG